MRDANARALERSLVRGEGVLHRRAVVQAGVDDAVADREVAAGRWSRPVPAVVVADAVPTRRQLMSAAVLHAAPHGLLTGTAAAELYALRDVPPVPGVDVLVPHAVRRLSTTAVRVRRSTSPPATRVVVLGLPAVRPARALADAVTGGLDLRTARALVLAAVSDDVVDVPDLERELTTGGGRRGVALLRQVVREAGQGLASAPEAELADVLRPWARQRGLQLLLNPWLLLDGEVLGRPDAYLPQHGVGVESDSVRHHGGRGLASTLQRHARLTRHGLLLGHETWASVQAEPSAVLARVEADLAQRAVAPWRPPPGLLVLPHDDPRAPRLRRRSRWWDVVQEPVGRAS